MAIYLILRKGIRLVARNITIELEAYLECLPLVVKLQLLNVAVKSEQSLEWRVPRILCFGHPQFLLEELIPLFRCTELLKSLPRPTEI